MSEKIETGGPAFPCHPEIIPHRDHDFAGMSLRDYFAAKAVQGFLTAKYASTYRPEVWAKNAYEMADAMLKAREAK